MSPSFSYLCLDCAGCLFPSCHLQSVLNSTNFASLMINLSSPSPSSSSSSSCCCYSLVPAVSTPRQLLHSILFAAALVFQLLTCTSILAGPSVLTPPACLHPLQCLVKIVQGDGVIPTPNHRLVDQASVTGWSVCTPGQRVSILVAYCDTRNWHVGTRYWQACCELWMSASYWCWYWCLHRDHLYFCRYSLVLGLELQKRRWT